MFSRWTLRIRFVTALAALCLGFSIYPLFASTPLSVTDFAARAVGGGSASGNYIKRQDPLYLSYEELKSLSITPHPKGALKKKLETFWRSPLISNEAYYNGVRPHKPKSPLLGYFLRVVSWNIEKSLNMPAAVGIFTETEEQFRRRIDFSKIKSGSEEFQTILRQRRRLHYADIVLLQEMEIGIKRSGYLNAAEELAKALDMNYVYAPQYLEIDPVTLGTETIELEDGGIDQVATDYYRVDQSKYKGVFGSAVLSRYPIKYVELRPLKNQGYDWYDDEIIKIGFLEKTRRFGAKTAFKNEMTRELKVGGRSYFRVDLEVPDLPEKTLTIINIHLEIKCKPKQREVQMREIMGYIKDIKNPLIMMGDYNAAPADISPTSVKRVATRTVKNPSTWFGVALKVAGSSLNVPRVAGNLVKNLNDPFASDIKIIAANPLKSMFMAIKDFRFDDGHAFDFRGDANRSIGNKTKILANSNQRGTKGFRTTFSVKRALGVVGKYRLDWVFVKSNLFNSQDPEGSYKFAPHFGETLEEMNTGLVHPVSDHHPSVIDLPFNEPNI